MSPSSSRSSSEGPPADRRRKPPVKSINLGVEYVISFRFTTVDRSKAESQFEKLVLALDRVGLRVEARDGRNGSILAFVRIKSQRKFMAEVYRSRVKDWLHGVRPAAPDKETQKSLDKEPVTDAERLRLVYLLITLPEEEGGAGITPKRGEWDCVESLFTLHDKQFNKEWLTQWSLKYSVSQADLTLLRDKFGEKVAFYFAFLQTYFAFLLPATCIGVGAYMFLPSYSPFFALANGLWSIIFVEWWRHMEVDLAVEWGVRGCSKIQHRRASFQPEGDIEDPVTGEKVPVFSSWKRLSRQLLQVPFAKLSTLLLVGLYAAVFAIEIFLTEVYYGPFKNILTFAPTVIASILVPTFSAILTNIATRLNEFENYENADSYEYAMIQKKFVINFIMSYTPLLLTAFVYVPFGSTIVPYLDIFARTVHQMDETHTMAKSFQINPDRLKKQVLYFVVTQQIIGLILELVVPYVMRRVFKKAKQIQSSATSVDHSAVAESDNEKVFLERVRDEAELSVYDVSADLREMVTQFGYLALFSPIWPLTALSCIINNWLELRSDAAKICLEMQRPVPLRGDSIGPWLDNLTFLSWLGSITSSALIYMFNSTETHSRSITLWGVLVSILLAENLYFGTRMVVRAALSKMHSPGLERERRERFLVRRRYLEESIGLEAMEEKRGMGHSMVGSVELEGVEDEDERSFWARGSPLGVVQVGMEIIGRAHEKKDQ